MSIFDWLVVAAYGFGMLAIGRYYGARTSTTDDYLLGGRNMSPTMIGLSLFATLTSTLSYLAVPGEVVKNGPVALCYIFSYPIAALVVGLILIPAIMRLHATSAYELLEERLGMTGRLLAASMFTLMRLTWMSAMLFATSDKVLIPLLGLDPMWGPAIGAVMAVITAIYTAEGGLRAVVVTDVVQSILMLGGAIVVLAVVTSKLGGVGAWWPKEWLEEWPAVVWFYAPNTRITVVGIILYQAIWQICTAGSDQMAIQRYLAVRDVKSARSSFNINLVTDAIMAGLLGLVGLAVLAYFQAHPEDLAAGTSASIDDADKFLPRFIVKGLPIGLTGLLISALLSAVMSSWASGMNSACAVITTDFMLPFRRAKQTPAQEVSTARWVSVGVAVTVVLLSGVVGMVTRRHPEVNLYDLCMTTVNLLTTPLFSLFFLAFFVPWSNRWGAIVSAIASVTVAVGTSFLHWYDLTFIWMPPLSLAAGIYGGLLGSSLTSESVPVVRLLGARVRLRSLLIGTTIVGAGLGVAHEQLQSQAEREIAQKLQESGTQLTLGGPDDRWDSTANSARPVWWSDATTFLLGQRILQINMGGDVEPSELEPLGNLSKLQELRFASTKVDNLKFLARLTRLRTLNIDSSQVTSIKPLAGLTNLRTLVLAAGRLTDVKPLASLGKLEALTLHHSQVTDLRPLAGLTNLQFMSLDSTTVTDLSPLEGLARLRTLVLNSTQVTDEQIKSLKSKLPDCTIRR